MKKPVSARTAPTARARRPRPERGASAVEYGLLLAGIAGVLVLAILLLGGTVRGLFDDTCNAVGQLSSTTCS